MARRRVREHALAEEAVQDAFTALWVRPEAWDPERGDVATFLKVIAARRAVDAARREAVRRRPVPYREAASTEDTAVRVQVAYDVQSALKRLSPEQRQALFLAYYAGFTQREVARFLEVPEGTAKARLRRGLGKLRKMLVDSAA